MFLGIGLRFQHNTQPMFCDILAPGILDDLNICKIKFVLITVFESMSYNTFRVKVVRLKIGDPVARKIGNLCLRIG